jgi:polyisoprenoid-binding protein YceI
MAVAAHLLAVFLAATAATAPLPFRLEPGRTEISFGYRIGFVHATGRITHAEGEGVFDPAHLDNSAISVRIDMTSLTTGNGMYDAILHGQDYFDVARYPGATFKSTRITAAGAGAAAVDGQLTLHGVTRPVRLSAVYSEVAGPRHGLAMSISGTVRRSDFGIGQDGFWIGDEIPLKISSAAVEDR